MFIQFAHGEGVGEPYVVGEGCREGFAVMQGVDVADGMLEWIPTERLVAVLTETVDLFAREVVARMKRLPWRAPGKLEVRRRGMYKGSAKRFQKGVYCWRRLS